jgi:hypothetical protein
MADIAIRADDAEFGLAVVLVLKVLQTLFQYPLEILGVPIYFPRTVEVPYRDATTVSGGILSVNGSITSDVTVQSGASLQGSGTIDGNTTIQSGGTLAAGNSPGILNNTGDLTFTTGSIFEWDLDLSQAPVETNRGVACDGVNVGGTLCGTDVIFKIVLTGTQDFTDSFWGVAGTTRTWTNIFTGSDGSTPIANWASIFGGGFQYSYNGETIAPVQGFFTVSGNSLSWTAVPEPSNAVVGLLVAAGLLRRRRLMGPARPS